MALDGLLLDVQQRADLVVCVRLGDVGSATWRKPFSRVVSIAAGLDLEKSILAPPRGTSRSRCRSKGGAPTKWPSTRLTNRESKDAWS